MTGESLQNPKKDEIMSPPTPALDAEFASMKEGIADALSHVNQLTDIPCGSVVSRFRRDCATFNHDLSSIKNPTREDLIDLNDRYHSLLLISEKIKNDEF